MGVVIFGYLFVQNWKSDRIGLGMTTGDTITISSVRNRMLAKQLILIDVRTEPEYYNDHIDGAILIPLQELSSRIQELNDYKTKEIIMVCRSGNRSGQATAYLNNNGFNAKNMLGGMTKWNRSK